MEKGRSSDSEIKALKNKETISFYLFQGGHLWIQRDEISPWSLKNYLVTPLIKKPSEKACAWQMTSAFNNFLYIFPVSKHSDLCPELCSSGHVTQYT